MLRSETSSVRVRGVLLVLSCLVCLSLVSGCGDGKVGALTPVEGKVTVAGAPLAAGTVTFHPVTPKAGVVMSIVGTIDATGKYTMTTNGKTGVPQGKYKVTVNTIVATQGASDPAKMGSAPTPASAPVRMANASFETPSTSSLALDVPSSSYDLSLTK